ncbi:hypothetical protein HanIR_Chr12g0561141 [Helianthus annuus]|nr:hypothetical protein HanIR_Chr12g0561141 [Helianthus annuus]
MDLLSRIVFVATVFDVLDILEGVKWKYQGLKWASSNSYGSLCNLSSAAIYKIHMMS